jgi:hypothetical protein
MKIEPSGVILVGICEIQTPVCQALVPAPITAVWAPPGRRQVNVCSACLEEQVRDGEWEIPGAHVRRRFDVVAYDTKNKLQVIVEVKSQPPSDVREGLAWALRIHRNLIVHAALTPAPFFLLVGFPDHFFLWKGLESSRTEAQPDYYYHGGDLLEPFFGILDPESDVRMELQHEKVVTTWLESLTRASQLPARASTVWLLESSLFSAISGGCVTRQLAAAV